MTHDKFATRVLGVGFAAALLFGGAACGDDDDGTTTDDDSQIDGMDPGDGLGGTENDNLGDLGDPNDPGQELEED